MRRTDREVVDQGELLEIMRQCDVCRLALNGNDGFPYIVPLNFGISASGDAVRLLFHSALEGHKMDLIKADPRASFEMDCDHILQYFEDKGYCTMAYASVMGKGHIRMMSGDEKEKALQKLMDQYHPDGHAYFNPAAIKRTAVYCLEVESMTGKRKLPKEKMTPKCSLVIPRLDGVDYGDRSAAILKVMTPAALLLSAWRLSAEVDYLAGAIEEVDA